MTTIPDCLAAFSVAAMMNSPEAAAKAKAAIDDYLKCFSRADHRPALLALKTAYDDLRLDSHVAIEIGAHIGQRMAYLPSRRSSGSSEGDHSPDA